MLDQESSYSYDKEDSHDSEQKVEIEATHNPLNDLYLSNARLGDYHGHNTPESSKGEAFKASHGTINNVININFNNCDKGQLNRSEYYEDEMYKKLYFDFLYESFRKNRAFEKITSDVNKEEVYEVLLKKNTPFHKYPRSIVNYLRNAESDFAQKVSS